MLIGEMASLVNIHAFDCAERLEMWSHTAVNIPVRYLKYGQYRVTRIDWELIIDERTIHWMGTIEGFSLLPALSSAHKNSIA